MTPERFAQQAKLSETSLQDYRIWHQQLTKWNARINLVAPNSLPDFWERHALDSAQILPYLPKNAKTIVDFGSGAGFPALAIAIHAKDEKLDRTVHMIESVRKKASFLRSVSRETGLNTVVHAKRIEAIPSLQADLITARAFAPLRRLLPLAWSHLAPNGELLLLKGESVEDELAEVRSNWTFTASQYPSLTSETGCLLHISGLSPA